MSDLTKRPTTESPSPGIWRGGTYPPFVGASPGPGSVVLCYDAQVRLSTTPVAPITQVDPGDAGRRGAVAGVPEEPH